MVPTEKIRNWNVDKASYFVRRKRHTFAVLLVVAVIVRRFTFFLGRITYVILRLVPTVVVRMTKNIERFDAVFARGSVKSAKRNVSRWHALFQSPPFLTIWIKLKGQFIGLSFSGLSERVKL